ncbi:MAG: DUF6125 family protein [Beijerinckiaceae bacterium]
MQAIDPQQLQQLLIRNWMTHDAMWFRHCAEQCGMEKTNAINRAAVRSMAAVEIRRIMKLVGIDEVRSMAALRNLIDTAASLLKGDFMDFAWSYPAPEAVRWDIRRCFAFEGVSKLGLIAQYECGIFERLQGWFDALGLAYEVQPVITGCMMHSHGACFREYRFALGTAARS